MTEFKLTIEAPDIADAIRTLAAAIQSRGAIAAEPAKTTKAKATTPTTTPAATPVVTPVAQTAAVNPTQVPAQTVTPVQAPAAVQVPPVATPVVPSAQAPSNPPLTLDILSNAGAGLLEKGMMPQLMALLGKYGVQAITQLKPDQYPAFASELRAMGALI